MRPEVSIVLSLSRIFGSTPFAVRDRHITFAWLSWTMLYFAVVALIGLLHTVLAFYVCIVTARDAGLSTASQYFGWIGYYFVTSSDHCLMLLKKDKIVKYLNLASDVWETYDEFAIKRNSKKSTVVYFWLWLMFGGLIPAATVSLNFFANPRDPIYVTNFFHDDPDSPIPTMALFVSYGIQMFMVLHAFLAILMSDLLPLLLCFSYRDHFNKLNDDFGKLASVDDFALIRQLGHINTARYQPGKILPQQTTKAPDMTQTLQVANLDNAVAINGNSQHSSPSVKFLEIRDQIQRHYNVQRCLNVFNDTFATFIILFLLQCFLMIVSLFYYLMKPGNISRLSTLLLYLCNGCQYLVRSTVVLYVFGAVQLTASKIRKIVVMDIGLQNLSHDTSLMSEVMIFLGQVDKIAVSAGSYLWFSPSFLLSFYGVLITYIAVMLQSI